MTLPIESSYSSSWSATKRSDVFWLLNFVQTTFKLEYYYFSAWDRKKRNRKLTWNGIFDSCYVSKVGRVGNTQTPHAVSVTPFSKMTLKRLWTFVCVIAANLAIVADVQAVQFVKPIWNGLDKRRIDKIRTKLTITNVCKFIPFRPNLVVNS